MLKRFMTWLLHRFQRLLGFLGSRKSGAASSPAQPTKASQGATNPRNPSDASPVVATAQRTSSLQSTAPLRQKSSSVLKDKIDPIAVEPDTYRRLDAAPAAQPGGPPPTPRLPTEVSDLIGDAFTFRPDAPAVPLPAGANDQPNEPNEPIEPSHALEESNQFPEIHDLLPALDPDQSEPAAPSAPSLKVVSKPDAAEISAEAQEQQGAPQVLSEDSKEGIPPATRLSKSPETLEAEPVVMPETVSLQPPSEPPPFLPLRADFESQKAYEPSSQGSLNEQPAYAQGTDSQVTGAQVTGAQVTENRPLDHESTSQTSDARASTASVILCSFDITESEAQAQQVSASSGLSRSLSSPAAEKEVIEQPALEELVDEAPTDEAPTVEALVDQEPIVEAPTVEDPASAGRGVISSPWAEARIAREGQEASSENTDAESLPAEVNLQQDLQQDLQEKEGDAEASEYLQSSEVAIPREVEIYEARVTPSEAAFATSVGVDTQQPFAAEASGLKCGIVKLLFTQKQGNFHGYVAPDDGSPDILFHQKYINADVFERLERGARVSVAVKHIEGKAYATRVEVL